MAQVNTASELDTGHCHRCQHAPAAGRDQWLLDARKLASTAPVTPMATRPNTTDESYVSWIRQGEDALVAS